MSNKAISQGHALINRVKMPIIVGSWLQNETICPTHKFNGHKIL